MITLRVLPEHQQVAVAIVLTRVGTVAVPPRDHLRHQHDVNAYQVLVHPKASEQVRWGFFV